MSNNFDAKGQVVFIEPKWVTGETCLFNVTNKFEYKRAQVKLTKIRKDFILRLEKEGFIITYDKKNIENDVISFIMNSKAICEHDKDIDVYKKLFDKRMFEAGGEKLNYPRTLTMIEYFNNPFFPAVLKNEIMNGGKDKFLIETEEQLEIIKKFYNDFSNNREYSEIFSCCIFQQLIETPTKYATYMRVLMSASGDVMGASLKYSRIEEQKRKAAGPLEKYFWDEKSEYYLNCKRMFNYYSDGGNIVFPQPKYSSEKREILEAHNINPNDVRVPSDVLEVSSSIAHNCNKELGIICGIDFIYNKNDNKWYYLEIQGFPAIEEWAVTRNIRVPKVKSVDDYIKYLEVELEARHDALMMYMTRKLEQEKVVEENKTKVLK